jgi:hypothetical protein
MRRRNECVYVCVDAVRGVASRADTMPRALEVDVPEDNILPATLGESEAVSKAESLVRWWARTRLFSWWAPSVSVGEPRLYHKPYLVEPVPGGRALKDTLSGETTPL